MIKNILLLTSTTGVARVITFLGTIIVAALYTPEGLGALSLTVSLIGIMSIVVCLGFDVAITASIDKAQLPYLALLAFLASIPMSLLCAIIFAFLTSHDLLGLHALALSGPFLSIVVPAWLLGRGLYSATTSLFIRTQWYKTFGIIGILYSGIRLCCQAVLGLTVAGFGSLLLSEILALWLAVLAACRCLPISFRNVRARDLLPLTQTYWRYPLIFTPSSLLNNLALLLATPLVAHYYGLTAAGNVALVQSFIFQPVGFLGTSIGSVFHRDFTEQLATDSSAAAALFLKVFGGLCLGSAILCLGIYFFGAQVIELTLGEKWSLAGQISTVMSLWLFTRTAVSPLSMMLITLDRQLLKLAYDVATLFATVTPLYVCHMMGYGFEAAIIALSISQSLAYIFYFGLMLWALKSIRQKNEFQRQ